MTAPKGMMFPSKLDKELWQTSVAYATDLWKEQDRDVVGPLTLNDIRYFYERFEKDAEKAKMDALLSTGGKTDDPVVAAAILEGNRTDTTGLYKMDSMDNLPACCVLNGLFPFSVYPGAPCLFPSMLAPCIASTCYYYVPGMAIPCKPIFYCSMQPRFMCHCRTCMPVIQCCLPYCLCNCPCRTQTCQLGSGKSACCAMTFVKMCCCVLPCCSETGLLAIDKIDKGYEPVATEPWKSQFGLPAAPTNTVIARVSEHKDKFDKDKFGVQGTAGKCAVNCIFGNCGENPWCTSFFKDMEKRVKQPDETVTTKGVWSA